MLSPKKYHSLEDDVETVLPGSRQSSSKFGTDLEGDPSSKGLETASVTSVSGGASGPSFISKITDSCVTPLLAWFEAWKKRNPGKMTFVRKCSIIEDRIAFAVGLALQISLLKRFYYLDRLYFDCMLFFFLLPYCAAILNLGAAVFRECRRRQLNVWFWLAIYILLSPIIAIGYDLYIVVRYFASEPVDSSGPGQFARYYYKFRLFADATIKSFPQSVFQFFLAVVGNIVNWVLVLSFLVSFFTFSKSILYTWLEARERQITMVSYLRGLLLAGSGFLPYEDVLRKEELSQLTMKRLQELDDEDLERIFTLVGNRRNLEELNLEQNHLGCRGFPTVANRVLLVKSSLQVLVLNWNNIDDQMVCVIAEALHNQVAPLRELFLDNNCIGNAGMKELCRSLMTHKTLQTLSLFGNRFSNDGANAAAEMLLSNKSLTKIRLGGNSIQVQGATALADALRHNSTIQFVDLSYNNFGSKGCEAVVSALVKHPSITVLDLSRNKFGDEAAAALAEALKKNSVLRDLRIQYNSISRKGVATLCKGVAVCICLKNLDLRKNQFGEEGKADLKRLQDCYADRQFLC